MINILTKLNLQTGFQIFTLNTKFFFIIYVFLSQIKKIITLSLILLLYFKFFANIRRKNFKILFLK